MATTVKNYLDDGIVSFAFPKIDTYINDKGEVKKKPIEMPSWKVIKQTQLLKNIQLVELTQLLLVNNLI